MKTRTCFCWFKYQISWSFQTHDTYLYLKQREVYKVISVIKTLKIFNILYINQFSFFSLCYISLFKDVVIHIHIQAESWKMSNESQQIIYLMQSSYVQKTIFFLLYTWETINLMCSELAVISIWIELTVYVNKVHANTSIVWLTFLSG